MIKKASILILFIISLNSCFLYRDIVFTSKNWKQECPMIPYLVEVKYYSDTVLTKITPVINNPVKE
jgi:hypothetical protein